MLATGPMIYLGLHIARSQGWHLYQDFYQETFMWQPLRMMQMCYMRGCCVGERKRARKTQTQTWPCQNHETSCSINLSVKIYHVNVILDLKFWNSSSTPNCVFFYYSGLWHSVLLCLLLDVLSHSLIIYCWSLPTSRAKVSDIIYVFIGVWDIVRNILFYINIQ